MPHPLSVVKKLPVFLFIYLIVNTAGAQVYNSSVSAATGGTGRAAVEPGDATFLNPGTLVHLRGHYLTSSFAENDLAITLSDNTPDSFLPASLGYVQKKSDLPQGQLKWYDINFSLAEFVVEKWALGVTGHYLNFTLPTSSYRNINADIGVIYTPKPHIGLGLVVYNIMGEDSNIPEEFRPKTVVGAGFNYIYQAMVRFRADATSDSIFMAGLETYMNQFLITRLGYSNNTDEKRELITAGMGFKGPKFALNYAYQGNPQNSGDYRHSVDLQIPF